LVVVFHSDCVIVIEPWLSSP